MDYQEFLKFIDGYKQMQVDLGRLLKEAKQSYDEWIGEGVGTWSDFLAQPEVGLSTREANSLIKLSDWVDAMGVGVNDLNLATARFAAQKGILEPDLLEDMKVLSLKDFKENHYDHVTQDRGERTYTYMVMKRCNETGNLSKIHGVESDEVEEKFKDKID